MEHSSSHNFEPEGATKTMFFQNEVVFLAILMNYVNWNEMACEHVQSHLFFCCVLSCYLLYGVVLQTSVLVNHTFACLFVLARSFNTSQYRKETSMGLKDRGVVTWDWGGRGAARAEMLWPGTEGPRCCDLWLRDKVKTEILICAAWKISAQATETVYVRTSWDCKCNCVSNMFGPEW